MRGLRQILCKLGFHKWKVWTEEVKTSHEVTLLDYQQCENPDCIYGNKPMLVDRVRKPW